jgi:hypothetical protein
MSAKLSRTAFSDHINTTLRSPEEEIRVGATDFLRSAELVYSSYADFRTGRVPSKTDGSPVRSSYSIEPSIFSLMLPALHLLIASSFSRKN